ncbi:hypothetical protein VTK26DRAFT_4682 [Humicola hyalothermophila]
MASSARGQHLDATGGREVVFCHACEHEWYRNRESDSLECPICHSSFIEIVDANNDPRRMNEPTTLAPLSSGLGNLFGRSGGSDSDPDEGDIEEHLHDRQPGIFARRSPFEPLFSGRDDRARDEGDAILRRFTDMLLNDFGAARAIRSPGQGLFPPPAENRQQSGTRIHQTTIRTGPFGSTRVTITSGTFGGGSEGGAPNFGTLFGQLFGNPMMVGADDPNQRGERAGQGPTIGLAGGLHEILNALFNPAAAVSGDAVFTQEALDRIITQLMETSPQTNAAPPASQSAIDSLERKPADDEMIGPDGKAECTICIDEIKKGDEVVVLPCKHWYHGECVVLWLKEHNTCPICRKPVETRGESGNDSDNNNASGSNQQSQQDPFRSSASTPNQPSAPTSGSSPFITFRPLRITDRSHRSARENAERLNAIRNLGNPDNGNGSGSGSGVEGGASGSSGMRRRNSASLPGAWPAAEGESRSTAGDGGDPMDLDGDENGNGSGSGRDYLMSGRRRNYVPGSAWREARAEREQQQAGSNWGGSGGGGAGGPLGWLRDFRDHFARGPGERDRRN